ncbi:MAG: ABC transporter substrate-binding protein [archaeon]|nr:ABC transporter substrate-binding protein [archaeon]
MDKKILAILAVVIVVAAGATVAFVVTNNNNGDKDKPIDIVGHNVYLEIFGNANGDYRLDNEDVKIIQDFVDNKITEKDLIKVTDADKKESHFLADANHDGKVTKEDVDYLKSVIDRSAKYIHFIDGYGHVSKCPTKIDRIASEYLPNAEILSLFGLQDKIVAVDNAPYLLADHYLMNMSPEKRAKVVNMNSNSAPNYDLVAGMNPDIWMTFTDSVMKKRDSGQTNAEVFSLNMNTFDADNIYASGCVKGVLLAGYLFNDTATSEKYVRWIVDLYDSIHEKTKNLADKDKPTVLYTMYAHYITTGDSNKTLRVYTDTDPCYEATELAGGKNLVDSIKNLSSYSSSQANSYQVSIDYFADPEVKYDYLFCHSVKYQGNGLVVEAVPAQGYLCNDNTQFKNQQMALNEIGLFSNLKDNQCYITNSDYRNNAAGGLLLSAYMAIILHPDLFQDFDMQKIHQSYLDMLGYNYDLSKNGVFYYQY